VRYRIVQYIQPWEIDDLERQIDQLIKSSQYVDKSATIILDITMNTSIVNWGESKIPEQYFLDKFKYLETKSGFYYKTRFDLDQTIKGCTDKRRSVQSKEQDFVIWLDSDLFFPVGTLPYMVDCSQQLGLSDYIISPETIRYWDTSWDCLTYSPFLSEPHNHRDYFDLYSLDGIQTTPTVRLNNQGIKFGGGWFNLISSNLFNRVPLVDELGSYAPDDTYLSICANMLRIPQYILSGVVVSEIGNKFLKNKDYIKPLLDIKIKDKEKISDQTFSHLIQKFNEKNILCNTKL